jgi:hypothetical protein
MPDNPDQLRIMKTLLKYHPQVAQAVAAVTAVTAKAKFPIHSFQELQEAMGGGETIEFGGRSFSMAELEQHVPAYYFPISNENDLIAKVGDLAKRMPAEQGGAPAADALHGTNVNPKLIAAVAQRPSKPAPTMSLDEMHRKAGFLARSAPSVGGVHE